MARGNDPGKDFDDQYNKNRREGQRRAARGEGPYAADKYLRDLNNRPMNQPPQRSEGCADKTVALLILLTSFGWIIAEGVSRI